MYHYTYMITVKNPTDARRLYIGVRSCKVPPEQDTYYGSCRPFRKWQKEHGVDGLHKQILAVWKSREDALSHEVLLHDCFDVATNQEFWNQAKQLVTKFDTAGVPSKKRGKPLSDEQKIKLSNSCKGRPSPFKGRKHNEDSKIKIGPPKGFVPWNKGTVGAQVAWNKGKSGIYSEEVLKKLSESAKSYHTGRVRPKVICPHCSKIGGANVMVRWHFYNCKDKT